MTNEEYDNLSRNVKTIVDTYDDDGSMYSECARIKEELEAIGYTCDYDLGGAIFDIKPMSVKN